MCDYMGKEDGQSMVEYVLILGLILLVAIGALTGIGGGVDKAAGDVASLLGSGNEVEDLGDVDYDADDWLVVLSDTNEIEYEIGNTGVSGIILYVGEDESVEIPREFYIKADGDDTDIVGVGEANDPGVIVHKVDKVNGMFMDLAYAIFAFDLEPEDVGIDDTVVDHGDIPTVKRVRTAPGLRPKSALALFFGRGSFLSADKNFTTMDMSGFDTTELRDASLMFELCVDIEEVELGKRYRAEELVDIKGMFSSCSSLKTLDLSSFNTSKVENMSEMFFGCESLSDLKIGKDFIIPTGTSVDDMVDNGTHEKVKGVLIERT